MTILYAIILWAALTFIVVLFIHMDDERAAKKHNRHVEIALRHMNKRRLILVAQEQKLAAEIDGLEEAIKALEG